MHQTLQGATFHVEHVVPRCTGGAPDSTNLAWCCPSCNLHKSDRVEFTDPVSGAAVPLFHPRQMVWDEHFEWHGYRLIGRTPVGRATVAALHLNHPRRLLIREAEAMFSLFPP
jgi:hypothetical protein